MDSKLLEREKTVRSDRGSGIGDRGKVLLATA